MYWTISLFVFSLVLSVLLTPLLRGVALRQGWVDQPDHKRKVHKTPIPRIGGVPVVLAYGGSLIILFLIGAAGYIHLAVVWSLLLPASLVFLIGLLDDFLTLQPWLKIATEVIAALVAYFGGIHIHEFLGRPVPSYVALPLTVAWLVACTNAFNLIDGLDGLAGGIGLVAILSALGAGFLQGDAALVTATAPLAGALLGFLIFNFNPASIFLGDGGSLWLGFMLASFGVIWSEKSVTVMSITAPMMALSIPLLDTALSIVRRFLRRQPILKADRGHIHHRLVDRGLSPRRAVLLLYAAGGVSAGFALLESTGSVATRGLILAVFVLLVFTGIRHLGYREFALAAHLLRQNTLRSMLQSDYSLQGYADSFMAAQTVEDCWIIVRAIAREFGFAYVQLRLGDRQYEEQLNTSPNAHWVLNIPVSNSEYVLFKYHFQGSTVLGVSSLADLLHRCLSLKRAECAPSFAPLAGVKEDIYLDNLYPSVEKPLSVSAS